MGDPMDEMIRQLALDQAVRTAHAEEPAESIVARAEAFRSFLANDSVPPTDPPTD